MPVLFAASKMLAAIAVRLTFSTPDMVGLVVTSVAFRMALSTSSVAAVPVSLSTDVRVWIWLPVWVEVKMGASKGRSVKKDLKLGVCGEHGGDPESIHLFYEAGLNYVSCSPFRVPIARLAAAQAVIGGAKKSDTK